MFDYFLKKFFLQICKFLILITKNSNLFFYRIIIFSLCFLTDNLSQLFLCVCVCFGVQRFCMCVYDFYC